MTCYHHSWLSSLGFIHCISCSPLRKALAEKKNVQMCAFRRCLYAHNSEMFTFQINILLYDNFGIGLLKRFLIFLRVRIKIQNISPYMVWSSGSTFIFSLFYHYTSPHSVFHHIAISVPLKYCISLFPPRSRCQDRSRCASDDPEG